MGVRREWGARDVIGGIARLDQVGHVAEQLRAERKRRLQRSELFGREFSQGSAWEILTDLYICMSEGLPLMACSIAVDANVPRSTVSRQLRLMEEAGLITVREDEEDRRRRWVTLKTETYLRMQSYVANDRLDVSGPPVAIAPTRREEALA